MDLKEALLKQNEEHTQSKIKWTTEKMELLADCVVDMLIKYNDKNLLSKLDGFQINDEKKEDKFADLVLEIMQKLNVPSNKRGAIHSQLSTIGCAYKENRNYNHEKGKEYKKIIDQKLASHFIEIKESIEFDENENVEEQLNNEHELYEGETKTHSTTTRKRNSKVRQIILERDNYICQCCGLKPIDLFKNTLHVHHNHPLHKSNGARKIKLDELITLCPTCHGYIHYKKEEITVEEVQLLLKNH